MAAFLIVCLYPFSSAYGASEENTHIDSKNRLQSELRNLSLHQIAYRVEVIDFFDVSISFPPNEESVIPIELLLPVFPSVFYGGYPVYLFECFEEGVFG